MPQGLESDALLYAAGLAFVLTHLAVLVYLARRNVGATRGSVGPSAQGCADAPGFPPTDSVPDDDLPPIEGEQIVRCPHCAVDNLADFRFCRYCVGELTGGTAVVESESASKDGQAF